MVDYFYSLPSFEIKGTTIAVKLNRDKRCEALHLPDTDGYIAIAICIRTNQNPDSVMRRFAPPHTIWDESMTTFL